MKTNHNKNIFLKWRIKRKQIELKELKARVSVLEDFKHTNSYYTDQYIEASLTHTRALIRLEYLLEIESKN